MSETQKRVNRDEDIVRLNPIDHIRRRPGMYIGGTDEKALHYLIYEVVNQSIDLAFAGKCNQIWVTLHPDNEVSIRDNGPGISTIINQFGKSQLEYVMTEIGMCGVHTRYTQEYHVSGGVHGVGIAAINALSEWMKVDMAYDGFLWQQEYRAGIRQSQIIQIRPLNLDESTGISFTFRPDFSIFQPNSFDYRQLANRFREVSYLVKGLTINLRDERPNSRAEATIHSDTGVVDYVKEINVKKPALHEPIYERFQVTIPREHHEPYIVEGDFALQYTDTTESKIMNFVNTVEVVEGGQHLEALKSTIANVVNEYDFYLDDAIEDFSQSEVVRGLTVVMHILHPFPSFESSARLILRVEPELYGAVSQAAFRASKRLMGDYDRIGQLMQKFEQSRLINRGGII